MVVGCSVQLLEWTCIAIIVIHSFKVIIWEWKNIMGIKHFIRYSHFIPYNYQLNGEKRLHWFRRAVHCWKKFDREPSLIQKYKSHFRKKQRFRLFVCTELQFCGNIQWVSKASAFHCDSCASCSIVYSSFTVGQLLSSNLYLLFWKLLIQGKRLRISGKIHLNFSLRST